MSSWWPPMADRGRGLLMLSLGLLSCFVNWSSTPCPLPRTCQRPRMRRTSGSPEGGPEGVLAPAPGTTPLFLFWLLKREGNPLNPGAEGNWSKLLPAAASQAQSSVPPEGERPPPSHPTHFCSAPPSGCCKGDGIRTGSRAGVSIAMGFLGEAEGGWALSSLPGSPQTGGE